MLSPVQPPFSRNSGWLGQQHNAFVYIMLVWHAGSITNKRLLFVEVEKNQWMYLLDPVPLRAIDASSAVKSLQYRNSQSVFANHVLMIFINAPSLVYWKNHHIWKKSGKSSLVFLAYPHVDDCLKICQEDPKKNYCDPFNCQLAKQPADRKGRTRLKRHFSKGTRSLVRPWTKSCFIGECDMIVITRCNKIIAGIEPRFLQQIEVIPTPTAMISTCWLSWCYNAAWCNWEDHEDTIFFDFSISVATSSLAWNVPSHWSQVVGRNFLSGRRSHFKHLWNSQTLN